MAVAKLADGPADRAGRHSTDSVLEVGTGLGSQTSILAALARHVYCIGLIRLIEELTMDARQGLARQGCTNVDARVGDGRAGWPDNVSSGRMVRSP